MNATPELVCGVVIGAMLVWTALFQYGLRKQHAEERADAARHGADDHAYEQVVQAPDMAEEGGVVDGAAPGESEAGRCGLEDGAVLAPRGLALGEAGFDQLGREDGVTAREDDGLAAVVDASENLSVSGVHDGNSTTHAVKGGDQ